MRPRLLRWIGAAVATAAAAAVLALLVIGGVGAFHAAGARTAASDVAQQIESGDTAGTVTALQDLERHSEGVGRWLGGAPWSWLTWLPLAGDTFSATVEVASAFDAVVTPLAPALAEVVTAADTGPAAAATALDKRSEIFVTAGREALAAEPTIIAIDTTGLPAPVAQLVLEAQEQFGDLVGLTTASAAASVLLPGLLGVDGPTPWLLVASQPAEARGSGAGFFGAVAVMEGSQGDTGLVAVHPNDDFYDIAADLTALPPEFAQLWGESASYVWAHNQTRHFPYAASLLAQSSAGVAPGSRYIVALDPSVVSAVLELTGPVSAAGVTLTAETAERYLTRDIYQEFPEGDDKDRVTSELLAAAFSALQSAEFAASELAQVMAAPIAEQRLVAWAADPREQEVLVWTPLAGGLPADELQLTAAINNAAGTKLDAYLRTSVDVTLQGGCDAPSTGVVELMLHLDEVPPGLPDYVAAGVRGPDRYAATRLLVHLYGPPGADLVGFAVDGEDELVQRGSELGRPVWGTSVDLAPGDSQRVSAQFEGQWSAASPLGFLAQPMINPTAVTVQDLRACPQGP